MRTLKSLPLEKRVCSECGAEGDKYNRLEVTGCGKVICHYCEMACKNYRRYMLPNGTHCMAAFEEEYFKYRLLAMNIPAPPSKVKSAKKKYESILSGELFEMLAKRAREYKTLQDSSAAANARVELEAIRQTLYNQIQKTDINKHLFEIFSKLAEAKKEYAK